MRQPSRAAWLVLALAAFEAARAGRPAEGRSRLPRAGPRRARDARPHDPPRRPLRDEEQRVRPSLLRRGARVPPAARGGRPRAREPRAQGEGLRPPRLRRLPPVVRHEAVLGPDAGRQEDLRRGPEEGLAPQPRVRRGPHALRPRDRAARRTWAARTTRCPSAPIRRGTRGRRRRSRGAIAPRGGDGERGILRICRRMVALRLQGLARLSDPGRSLRGARGAEGRLLRSLEPPPGAGRRPDARLRRENALLADVAVRLRAEDAVAKGKTPGGFFYSSKRFSTPEHGGTHLDAPVHFFEGGESAEAVSVRRLVAPAVVIDVSAKAKNGPRLPPHGRGREGLGGRARDDSEGRDRPSPDRLVFPLAGSHASTSGTTRRTTPRSSTSLRTEGRPRNCS